MEASASRYTGQSNEMISIRRIPIVKAKKSETSCNTVSHQIILLPQESIYEVPSLEEINTQQDVLNIQISNVQGASPDQKANRDELMPVNQIENHVDKLRNLVMQSTLQFGTHERIPLSESLPGGQLSKHVIIQEKRPPVETDVRSPVNQSSILNGEPLTETAKQKKELSFQLNSHERVPSYHLSHQPEISQMSNQYPACQTNTNGMMQAYQVDTQETLSSYENGTSESVSSHQISVAPPSNHMSSHATVPVEIEVRSQVNQSNVHYEESLTETAKQEKELSFQFKNSHERVTCYHLSHQPENSQMSNQYPPPACQMRVNGSMPAYQVNTQGTALSSYQNGVSEIVSSYQVSTNLAPPSVYTSSPISYMGTQEKMPNSQLGNSEKNILYQANYHTGMSTYHGGYNSHCSQQTMPFSQTETHDMTSHQQRSSHTCNCCCRAQNDSGYYSASGLETQRPSVIMVPVHRHKTTSCVSHVPLKVDTTSLRSENRELIPQDFTNRMDYSDDSDSSDDDDEYRKQEKYFRKNIDGTTARFKLTKEDWSRIPINTFPSGGRLLSGDWTRIFLTKVKESNPWCSLRFKNNHVRSENSRKIHSAVFFRGGAECKRPECNVKVRFVIRKEKGKHVDVTYVGDICHNSQPGGSDEKKKKTLC